VNNDGGRHTERPRVAERRFDSLLSNEFFRPDPVAWSPHAIVAEEAGLPRQKRDAHLYEFAKRGAEARWRELIEEVQLLVGLFPHLRDNFDKDELPIRFIIARGSGQLTKRGRGRRSKPMSAAARKAVSVRMKKYWAAKRKATKG
jgi:hypothetical protein